jgi:hypothetical protein
MQWLIDLSLTFFSTKGQKFNVTKKIIATEIFVPLCCEADSKRSYNFGKTIGKAASAVKMQRALWPHSGTVATLCCAPNF